MKIMIKTILYHFLEHIHPLLVDRPASGQSQRSTTSTGSHRSRNSVSRAVNDSNKGSSMGSKNTSRAGSRPASSGTTFAILCWIQ